MNEIRGGAPALVLGAALARSMAGLVVVVALALAAARCSSAPASEPRAPAPALPSPAAAPAAPASTAAAEGVATQIELHVEPLADLWLYLRMLAESRGREPVEPWLAEAVEPVAELGRALRAAGVGWHIVDTQLHFATTVAELRRVFTEVRSLSAAHGGDPAVVRAIERTGALLEVASPRFREELWREHERAIAAARERLGRDLLAVEDEALGDVLRSLAMEDPGTTFHVYLTARGPFPEAVTYRAWGGVPVSFVGVLSDHHAGTLLSEIVLHESHHALEGASEGPSHALARLRARLAEAGASASHRHTIPHNLMFIQAAETVRRVLDPEHRDYGFESGYYERAAPALEQREIWLGHLRGERTLDEALDEMAALASGP